MQDGDYHLDERPPAGQLAAYLRRSRLSSLRSVSGFSTMESGRCRRTRKILRPVSMSAMHLGAAVANLGQRIEPQFAYPGLRALVRSFYRAIAEGGRTQSNDVRRWLLLRPAITLSRLAVAASRVERPNGHCRSSAVSRWRGHAVGGFRGPDKHTICRANRWRGKRRIQLGLAIASPHDSMISHSGIAVHAGGAHWSVTVEVAVPLCYSQHRCVVTRGCCPARSDAGCGSERWRPSRRRVPLGIGTAALVAEQLTFARAAVAAANSTGHDCIDRYAPRCGNFVAVVPRIAVLGARSARRNTGQPAKRPPEISRGRAP